MLRRRILASAMASVMALGSVAVVASAEETTVKPVKTLEDLTALVGPGGTYGDSYRSNDIYNYGTVFGDLMLDTLEFADTVLEDPEATVDDYTAAYDMVQAVAERFVLKTVTELKELLDACKNIYETENINNAELGDILYTPASFATFEEKYEDAEAVIDSGDSRIITDAYLELKKAYDDLAKLPDITKSAFTSAVKAMEKALDKEKAYDQWRRGKTKSGGDPFWFDWYFSKPDGKTWTTWGELHDWLRNYTDWIYKKYDEFVEVKIANKTTLEDIVYAGKLAQEIAAIINNWTPDDTNRATKASVTKLLDKYHGKMVEDFEEAEARLLYESIYHVVTTADAPGEVSAENYKGKYDTDYYVTTPGDVIFITDEDSVNVTMNIKSSKAFYIMLNDEGYAIKDEDTGLYDIRLSVPSQGKYKKISANVKVDILDYVKVTIGRIQAKWADDHWGNDVHDADGWVADFSIGAAKLPLFGNDINGDGDYDDEIDGKQESEPIITYIKVGDEYQFTNGAFDIVLDKEGKNTGAARPYKGNGDTMPGKDNRVTMVEVMPIVYNYLAAKKPEDFEASGIHWDPDTLYGLDTIGQIAKGTAKGSASEWTIVHRALKYVLEDRYGADDNCHHKRADLAQLIEDSYVLEAETSKAAIFADSLEDMIAVREVAREWLKLANADKKYKDNITYFEKQDIPLYVETGLIYTPNAAENPDHPDDKVYADDMYHTLKGFYDGLNEDYQAFNISFGDIYDLIADVEDKINEGELEETPELRAAISEAAYRLAIATEPSWKSAATPEDPDADLDDEPYTEDRYFIEYNRVYTGHVTLNKGDYNITVKRKPITVYKTQTNTDLYEAYLALVKASTPAEEVLLGDVNADGKVNAMDAAAILKNVVNNVATDVKVGDFNADGKVDAMDAAAILKFVVNGGNA